MKLIFSFLVLIASLFPHSSYADSNSTLTLDQAIQIAIQNNPRIKAAQAQLGINEADILTARTRLNPSLVSDNGVAEKTYRLGIQQTIELGAKRQKRVALAQAQRDVALSELNIELLNLRTDVRKAYTQAYNAQLRQQNYENILQVSQELVHIAHEREKAGDIAQLDVLQSEIVSVNAQNELQSSVQEIVITENRLNTLLNQPLTTNIKLSEPSLNPANFPIPIPPVPGTKGPMLKGSITQVDPGLDVDGLIESAYQHRPELQQVARNLEVTRKQLVLAQANRIPNFSLALGPDLVTEPDQRRLNIFLTGTMDLPVFNRQQGPIQAAIAQRHKLEQEQFALKKQIALEVSNAYTAFQMNQERVKRFETQVLPYSIAIVDKSREAFREGKTNILMPINAQQAYINTRLGYLQALMDLQNAISDLERALGAGL